MVVIGLGTNLGNRLENLNIAVKLLGNVLDDIKTSLVYETNALLLEESPRGWDIPYYNMVITGNTKLSPHELLGAVKSIEKTMGRATSKIWAPRIIDIDIIFYDDVMLNTPDLVIPHEDALNRPFVMVPMYQLIPGFRHPALGMTIEEVVGNFRTYVGSFLRVLALSPKIVGIINVTPDSFSDGGLYMNVSNAVEQALVLMNDGASVLDIGAQSTHPHAKFISGEEELSRLLPFMEELTSELKRSHNKVRISIDTFRPEVIERLIEKFDIDIINDVSGVGLVRMLEIAQANNLKYVLLHSHEVPTRQTNLLSFAKDPVSQLLAWAKVKLEEIKRHGFDYQNLIFDPGIGFDKSPSQCAYIIRHIEAFRELGVEILLGHSRKTFMNMFSSNSYSDRDTETAAIAALAAHKLDYIRVHSVANTHKAIVASYCI